MEGCGQNCLKWLMFIFNFLFFICGGGLLGVGIWVVVDASSFINVIGDNPVIFNAVYIIIAVGAALLVISFLGCCGAIKENKCLLGMFFGIVFVIFVVEIVGGVLAFVFLPQVEEVVINSMKVFQPNVTGTDASPVSKGEIITQGWNTIQAVFPCCGYNAATDWENSTTIYPTADGDLVPLSCCERDVLSVDGKITNQTNCVALTGNYHTLGCKEKVQTYFWLIGGIGIGVLVIELLAMIFACCLYCAVGKDY